MGFYEQVSGARMHAAYFRPGGVAFDVTKRTLEEIMLFCSQYPARLDEIEELLTYNRIWRKRLVGVGSIRYQEASSRGITGVLLRSVGCLWDLRKVQPYESYSFVDFKSIFGLTGDCFDRYLIRMAEMRESLACSTVFSDLLLFGKSPFRSVRTLASKSVSLFREFFKLSMEVILNHFEVYGNRGISDAGEYYGGIEAPKGEFGSYLSLDGTSDMSYRCKIRSPGFSHLQCLDYMTFNHFLSDVTTVIGTQDIVFGEVDR